MIIILLGPPGSGKGTQARLLAENLKAVHLSTGDLFRAEIQKRTPLGLSVKDIMDNGGYVSDDIVMSVIESYFKNLDSHGIILFDGFPRTLDQAVAFDSMLQKQGLNVDRAIHFNIDDETIVSRLSARFSCENCGCVYNELTSKPLVRGVCDKCGSTTFTKRDDDKASAIKTRLNVYHSTCDQVEDYYRQKNLVDEVDAKLDAKKIHQDLLRLFNTNHEPLKGER